MNGATHAQRILSLLSAEPDLNDDEIARTLGIAPRQTVNQICRALARRGILERRRGNDGKIFNRVGAGEATELLPAPTAPPSPRNAPAQPGGAHASRIAQWRETLIILPCSAEKTAGAIAVTNPRRIADDLPSSLASELADARRCLAASASVDASAIAPAMVRYSGSLYRSAGDAISRLANAGAHIVILSGGYGVVLATEPIGTYDARLRPSAWPNRLLPRILETYAVRHGIRSVRAFASATGPYVAILRAATGRGPESRTRS